MEGTPSLVRSTINPLGDLEDKCTELQRRSLDGVVWINMLVD